MPAIYRKYRPNKLEDLLGQEITVEIIKNQAKANQLAQAYLFYGSRGSGKTTTARLIAKLANCQKRNLDENFRQFGEPCNQCQSCQEMENNQAFDVIEIDAASNRGIDEIRSLKENIRLSPANYSYKIFIIDEVHQLTKEAFNALLKTLEEPPSHAILILATTEIEKVPLTIISRAQKFHFKKIPLKEIIEKLKKICENENISYSIEALELIAATAEGSLRDAESLLEQIFNMERNVKIENIEKILGRTGFSKNFEFATLLINNNLKEALHYIYKIHEDGYEITQFTKDTIHYFRKILALKFNPALEEDFKKILTQQELTIIKNHTKEINVEKIIKLTKSLIEAYSQMKYSPFAIIPLEISLIENLN